MTHGKFEGRTAAEAAIKACDELGTTRAALRYELISETGEGMDKRVVIEVTEIDEAAADHGSLILLLAFMIIGGILVIVFGVVLGNHFLGPVMQIEEGLLKVINGEYSYRFDVKSAEVGGLSYRINQLIGVLTGEEEEAEDES